MFSCSTWKFLIKVWRIFARILNAGLLLSKLCKIFIVNSDLVISIRECVFPQQLSIRLPIKSSWHMGTTWILIFTPFSRWKFFNFIFNNNSVISFLAIKGRRSKLSLIILFWYLKCILRWSFVFKLLTY